MTTGIEEALKTEDTLLGILNKISKRHSENHTYLTLDEVYELMQVPELSDLTNYVAESILTEENVSYDKNQDVFNGLDYGKLNDSIKNILVLGRLLIDSPQWKRGYVDQEVMQEHLEIAEGIKEQVDYLRENGKPDELIKLLDQQEPYQRAFWRDVDKMHGREAGNAAAEEEYLIKMEPIVKLIFIKEQLKYPHVRLKKYIEPI